MHITETEFLHRNRSGGGGKGDTDISFWLDVDKLFQGSYLISGYLVSGETLVCLLIIILPLPEWILLVKRK